jgi:chemotaxis-related protein WspD
VNHPTIDSAVDQTIPDDLAERTAYFARPRTAEECGTETAFVFRVGSEWLALPVSVVHGVSRPSLVHSLPHRRSGGVLGIVNVAGELLVCASLRAIVGIADPGAVAAAGEGRVLLLRHDGVRAACPVDEVEGLVRFHAGMRREPPATVARAQRTMTFGVIAVSGKNVALLDTPRLFQALHRSFA